MRGVSDIQAIRWCPCWESAAQRCQVRQGIGRWVLADVMCAWELEDECWLMFRGCIALFCSGVCKTVLVEGNL